MDKVGDDKMAGGSKSSHLCTHDLEEGWAISLVSLTTGSEISIPRNPTRKSSYWKESGRTLGSPGGTTDTYLHFRQSSLAGINVSFVHVI